MILQVVGMILNVFSTILNIRQDRRTLHKTHLKSSRMDLNQFIRSNIEQIGNLQIGRI